MVRLPARLLSDAQHQPASFAKHSSYGGVILAKRDRESERYADTKNQYL